MRRGELRLRERGAGMMENARAQNAAARRCCAGARSRRAWRPAAAIAGLVLALAAAAAGSAPAIAQATPAHVGDLERGERRFHVCAPCHDIGPKARNRTGPALSDLIGAPIGAREGFASSFVMAYFGVMGEVWTEELLDRYIAGPKVFLQSEYPIDAASTSPFVGIDDPQIRADIVAYVAANGVAPRRRRAPLRPIPDATAPAD